jgi:D-amino-acid oxidase
VVLEKVPSSKIIHNYGHGGSGVTLSWGCAEEVLSLVDDIVNESQHEKPKIKINSVYPTIFVF